MSKTVNTLNLNLLYKLNLIEKQFSKAMSEALSCISHTKDWKENYNDVYDTLAEHKLELLLIINEMRSLVRGSKE